MSVTLIYVFSSVSFADTGIKFSNFGKSLVLTKYNDHYVLNTSSLKVNLSNRLIIKSEKSVPLKESSYIKKVSVKFWPVYQGESFTYFVLELKDSQSVLNTMKKLINMDGILLVQPDIIQYRHYANDSKNKYSGLKNSDLEFDYVEQVLKPSGELVNVAIIDDGVDLTHPTLIDTNVKFEYDVEHHTLSAAPKQVADTHGTMVAQTIFGKHQYKGEVTQANLIAIRQPTTWTSNTLLAFQIAKLNEADIINCSWHSNILLEPVKDVIDDLAIYGRKGKGVAVVISAGNQGKLIEPLSTEAAIKNAIVVGAKRRDGELTKFSNYGEHVDFFVVAEPLRMADKLGNIRYFSGTSLASAIVTRRLAVTLISNSRLKLNQLVNILRENN
ncbi:S8 family peptidase [Catenovulum adriaticum]|uniref:S8/S53 family peptidase n=1 Tax=Catenovulum adriaticum TaxID=2984846 RepID=A0ABY7API6_9ALTE|nr:S8/S53 family peptidase [Catenovulum sp. TS8]WAJ71409.1 S8/S53 family peptidase [Catenovulum sp. TS8]